MSDEPTEWVTVKVPVEDREKANDYRPDGTTYGDCLVAGADRLNETQGTDMSHRVGGSENADLFAEQVVDLLSAELGAELTSGSADADAIADAVADAEASIDYDDVLAATRQAIREELPVEEMGR